LDETVQAQEAGEAPEAQKQSFSFQQKNTAGYLRCGRGNIDYYFCRKCRREQPGNRPE
jgi:hypothetical protein